MLKKQYLKNKQVAKVTFSLPAEAVEGAADVRLVGDFNNWNVENSVPMQVKGKEFQATLELPAGRKYEFRYLADQSRWLNDWQADAYVPSPFGGIDNSVLSLDGLTNGNQPEVLDVKPAKVATAPKAAKPAKAEAPKAAKAAKTAAVTNDDLTKIEGVGPKIQTLLQEKGILTFSDLAKAKVADLKAILEAAGSRYKMHDPASWAKQAKLAADGQWEKLQQLQNELKGGK